MSLLPFERRKIEGKAQSVTEFGRFTPVTQNSEFKKIVAASSEYNVDRT